MRSIILASLALTPSLLFAQATTPAKTANTVLLSSVSTPAAPKGRDADVTPAPYRVSTGITAPVLLQSGELAPTGIWRPRVLGSDMTVVVNLIVDETGKAVNVSIAKSAGAMADQDALAAVSRYRYQPGTLNGQAIAVPVTLTIVVERGARY